MKLDRWTRRATFILAALGALLSGCTSYVTTQVTAFSDWSGNDASRTYAFTREGGQENSIEQATYEGMVANELAVHAFRRADAAEARYLVSLSYSIRRDTVSVSEPLYLYNPWPGPYWRSRIDPWGPFGPYPAGYVNSSYPEFTHTLGLRITERADGREVYSVVASSVGDEPALVQTMPYLARGALAGFPLGNGVARTVRIPVDNNGGIPAFNEVAATAAPAAAAPPKIAE